MTMTKHTDGAVKAAVEVIRELRLLVPSGDINAPKGTLAIKGTEIDLKDIAAIIDQETAAPDLLQLFAERDRLRKALEDIASTDSLMIGSLGWEATIDKIIGCARAALAKELESGEKEE